MSNISEPFDIRKMANEILGTAFPPTRKPALRSFDPHCWDLAQLFLSDEPLLKGREDDLAAHIQETIESWIGYERDHAGDKKSDAAGAFNKMMGLDGVLPAPALVAEETSNA
jgi:hypothetical protein